MVADRMTATKPSEQDRKAALMALSAYYDPLNLHIEDRVAAALAAARADGLDAACRAICEGCAQGLRAEEDGQGGYRHLWPDGTPEEDCLAGEIRRLLPADDPPPVAQSGDER